MHDQRYHYIRTYTPGPTFASLNRYKEKCFAILPLLRQLQARGELTGPAAALLAFRGPAEELYDTHADPHEIHNLAASPQAEHRQTLLRLQAALDTWITETGDAGQWPEPPEIVVPFVQEMHDWFGTPAWHVEAERQGATR